MIWRFIGPHEVVYLRADSEAQARARFADARPGVQPDVVQRYRATVRPVTLQDVVGREREAAA